MAFAANAGHAPEEVVRALRALESPAIFDEP